MKTHREKSRAASLDSGSKARRDQDFKASVVTANAEGGGGGPVKLETHGGPMQGPTAGIIRVLVLIHVAEIGIDLRGEGKRSP